jgi:hypothetical protein
MRQHVAPGACLGCETHFHSAAPALYARAWPRTVTCRRMDPGGLLQSVLEGLVLRPG